MAAFICWGGKNVLLAPILTPNPQCKQQTTHCSFIIHPENNQYNKNEIYANSTHIK